MRLSNGQSQLQEYGFTHFTEEGFMSQQSGILRTNCLDCLDRTNAVQTLFALEALEMLLESFSIDANHSNKFKGKSLTISCISYNMGHIIYPHPIRFASNVFRRIDNAMERKWKLNITSLRWNRCSRKWKCVRRR